MAIITFPKILTDRLTDEGARALADILNAVEENTNKKTLEAAEQRFERRLSEEIGKLRADIIRWMFVFWVGQSITVIGVMQAFLSKH